MTEDRFARARELFTATAALEPEARPAFLDEACEGDLGLRAEVEELLRFHDAESIDLPEGSAVRAAFDDGKSERTIGDYRLLQKLGEGGMGEVWEAEQQRPVRRRVAVKLIRWGLATREVIARFESERQALALMDHPGIARVYQAGSTSNGRPYFAMELVNGVAITDYCDTHLLSTTQRLRLFIEVCQAVQHAHHKGIIHRDLKPSNVLVTVQSDQPVPKIIDFGVAKATSQRLTEKTVFTELGQWIGTPEYMSPEQAEMTGLDIDTRTDVYSLGVILYELLAGAQPFDSTTLRSAGFDEMRRRIREDEPPRPSTRVSKLGQDSEDPARRRQTDLTGLVRELEGDLDWIVMRAMEKDRTRRYNSPAELAADISRHLDFQPVLACPPGTIYRIRKYVRRHRLAVAAAMLVAASLIAGIIGTTAGLLRARQEADSSRKVSDFMVSMYRDLNPSIVAGHVASSEEMLSRAVQRLDVELADEPLVQASLLLTLGDAYKELGRFESALPLLERSAEIRRRLLGEEHPDYAMSISFLGDLLSRTGDFENARSLHRTALRARERAHGPEHETVAWSLRSLAATYQKTGDYDRAREHYRRSIEVLESAAGEDSHDTSVSLHGLAALELAAGKPGAALPLLERCLAIRLRQLDPDHPELATCLLDLGRVLFYRGESEKPVVMTSRAVEIFRKAYASDHPKTAMAMGQLAVLEHLAGNARRAVAMYEEILAIQRRSGQPIVEELLGHPEFAAMVEVIDPQSLAQRPSGPPPEPRPRASRGDHPR